MWKIIWNWNNFTWWESDTVRQWPTSSIQSWVSVDIRTVPWEVRLSKELTDTGWVFDSDITHMQSIEQYWGNWVVTCCEDWEIYFDNVKKYTLTTTTSGHETIIGMAYKAWYLYYFTRTNWTDWKIHRSTLDGATFEEDYKTFITNNAGWNRLGKVPSLSEAARIIFASWSNVFELDSADTLTTKLTFSDIDEIISLTVFQTQIRIYSNIEDENTYQYFWDGTSDSIDYRVGWRNLAVRSVENAWGYDYAITWYWVWEWDLYQIAWSQRQEQRVNKLNWEREFDSFISSKEEMYYISGRLARYYNWDNNWINGIYTYGNYFPWYAKSLILEHPAWLKEFIRHTHESQNSYFATDTKVYRISVNMGSFQWYNTYWELISLKWNWGTGNGYIKKSIDYAYVGCDDLSLTKYIEIFARADWWGWKLLKTLNSNNMEWGTRIDRNEFQAQKLWDFFDLEYKVVLHGNWDYTPMFKWIETYITTWVKR